MPRACRAQALRESLVHLLVDIRLGIVLYHEIS